MHRGEISKHQTCEPLAAIVSMGQRSPSPCIQEWMEYNDSQSSAGRAWAKAKAQRVLCTGLGVGTVCVKEQSNQVLLFLKQDDRLAHTIAELGKEDTISLLCL